MIACTRLVLLLVFSSLLVLSQQKQPAPQTPRQALIEMMNGGEQAIRRHLTIEIQQMIQDMEQKKSNGKGKDADTGVGFDMPGIPGMIGGSLGFPVFGKDLEKFDSGNVFLRYKDWNGQQVVEIRVDTDDLRGDEDELQLSIHLLADGQEMEVPYMPNIILGMKKQQDIWRINSVGGSVKAEIGNPDFFLALAKLASQKRASAHKAAAAPAPRQEPMVQDVSTTVSILAFAESTYAQRHPDIGFTCNLADLLNHEEGSSFPGVLDPQIATGAANGYRYSISGCETKPAEIFHLTAEPVAQGGGAKAYCTNATHILRVADDGRGSTCLSSGRVLNGASDTRAESKDHDEVGVRVVK